MLATYGLGVGGSGGGDNIFTTVDIEPMQSLKTVSTVSSGGSSGSGGTTSDSTLFVPTNQQVALIVDQKPSGTNGGSSVSGWQVRDLNTEVYDDDGLVSVLGDNGFRLQPGEYQIEWSAPAYRCARTQSAISTSTSETNIVSYGSVTRTVVVLTSYKSIVLVVTK